MYIFIFCFIGYRRIDVLNKVNIKVLFKLSMLPITQSLDTFKFLQCNYHFYQIHAFNLKLHASMHNHLSHMTPFQGMVFPYIVK